MQRREFGEESADRVLDGAVAAGVEPRWWRGSQVRGGVASSDLSRTSAAGVAMYVVMSAIALVFVVPLVWPIVRSLEPGDVITQGPSALKVHELTLSNYWNLIVGPANILLHLGNSLLVAAGTILMTGIVATLAGYGFGRFQFRGRNLIFLLILSTLMIPFQGLLTPLFLELHWLDLSNSLLGLMLVYTTFCLPFAVFIMRNSFQQVPVEVEESARVDGASAMSVLVRVLVPLVMPGIITVCILAFLFAWTEFLAALTLLTSDNVLTLPVELLGIEGGNYAALEAGAVIAMIPAAALYVALQRYYVAGFTAGAIRG